MLLVDDMIKTIQGSDKNAKTQNLQITSVDSTSCVDATLTVSGLRSGSYRQFVEEEKKV